MRRHFAIFATALLAVAGLAGCSSPGASTTCTYQDSNDSALAAIDVSGAFGSQPTVNIPAPFKATANGSKIIKSGNGALTQAGEYASIDATLYNGETGKAMSGTSYDGKYALLPLTSTVFPGFAEALTCAPIGSRILSVVTVDDTLAKKMNIPTGTTVVGVFDIHDAFISKADGTPQVVPDGFPMVVLADDGTPGMTFLAGAKPPTELRITTLKKGQGAEIEADSVVTVKYAGWLWPTDGTSNTTEFDSSWGENKAPATFAMTGGTISGFSKALIGQRVGSQIEVIIPPAEGYGSQDHGSIPGNSTLVFVVDILQVAK